MGYLLKPPCYAGNVPVQEKTQVSSPPAVLQTPTPSAPSQSSVHLPSLPPADKSALLHAIAAPAQQQQESSLTALISPDSNARFGTFTPHNFGAALTCRIPELVGSAQKELLTRPRRTPLPLCIGVLEAIHDNC